jgi:hypothetical protein
MRARPTTAARSRLAAGAALLLAGTLGLGGCAGTDSQGKDRAGRASSPSPTSPVSSSPTTSPRATAAPSASANRTPVGSATDPAVLGPGRDLLDWSPVPGSVKDTVTRGGGATLSVDEAGSRARLEAKGASVTITATSRQQVSDALLDGSWAVVVLRDRQEVQPASTTVVDLRTGKRFTIDGSSAVPTVNGGTWALGAGHLLHATTDRGAYCVASVDLASRAAERDWCAPPRQGFNAARITPAGDTLLTFDGGRPVACRTPVRLTNTGASPIPGVAPCKAWESLALDDGAVWSVIPNEHKIDESHVFAHTGASWLDLGPATAGTLTWCGNAAYFVRDPQRDGAAAALMRWRPADGLDVVYESPGGQAFLSAPRCGGDTMTVTAFAQSGDEQVSAPLT